MKPSKARVAAHLGVTEGDIFQIAERGDQVVVILSDYRKMVFPASALEAAPVDAPAPRVGKVKK